MIVDRSRRSRTWPALLCLALSLAIAGVGVAQAKRGIAPAARVRELWLFFSPSETRLAPEIRMLGDFLKRHPDIALRPALLAQDTAFVKAPPADLAESVKALAELPGPGLALRLWDDEGLARARDLGIDRFPAWALVDSADASGVRRARVATGYAPRLEELLR